MVAVFGELRSYDWRPHLGDLRAPTLVVHGDEDRQPVDSAFEWSSSVADGQVLVLPGVGQLPWAERPDAFFAAVDRFLTGPPGPPG
jgi:pimeloyl-ACP methyl ester carboxylesterase